MLDGRKDGAFLPLAWGGGGACTPRLVDTD